MSRKKPVDIPEIKDYEVFVDPKILSAGKPVTVTGDKSH
jgi:hypothetical protein